MLLSSIPWAIPTPIATRMNDKKAFNLKSMIRTNKQRIPMEITKMGIILTIFT
jgi:hypothetical protein